MMKRMARKPLNRKYQRRMGRKKSKPVKKQFKNRQLMKMTQRMPIKTKTLTNNNGLMTSRKNKNDKYCLMIGL
jgi:hypothetical protein